MKNLVLLFLFFAAMRSFGAVATNVQNLSQFGTTNKVVPGDGIGLSTRYGTGSERLYGLRVSNLVSSLNALGAGTNTVLLSAGTNITVTETRTASNVTYTISVSSAESSMTNALLHAGPTNGSVGALILTAGSNILIATSGTNRFISTSNNVSLVDVTNIVAGATNGFTSVSPPLSSVQYNSNGVQKGSSGFVFTNGLVGIGTNAPPFLLSLFAPGISDPILDMAYPAGAGNTTAIRLRNGAGATNFTVGVDGLINSATIFNSITITSETATVTSLNVKGGTLGAGKVLTDTGGTGAATWQTASGTDLASVTNVVTNYVNSVLGAFINLSVQAAKLPATNYAAIDAGWQNWELLYYPTNSEGFTNSLGATWQFICPTNYMTNSMKVYGQSIILSTNGPTATNIYWRASFFKATSGDSTDVHVGAFGSSVTVTQTWAASNTGTNKMQDFLIDMSTSSLLQRNDFGILKLERVNDIADTNQFKGTASLIGLQLRY